MDQPMLPTTLTGPPLTAVGVAVIRARENQRADRLYSDPYAALFVEAAEQAYLDPEAPQGAADTWATVLQLADVMYETRTFGVRITDDGLMAAAAEGRTQIVFLGAGLDTHAFRLAWPRPVRLFEIDMPELFAFKEPILSQVNASPVCDRRVTATDLSGNDWPETLLAHGFQPENPTHWVDHALMTLPRTTAQASLEAITELSAPGSQYTFPVMDRGNLVKTMRPAEDLYRSTPSVERGLGEDAQQWIESLGWATTLLSFNELIADYPRKISRDTTSAGTIVATRR